MLHSSLAAKTFSRGAELSWKTTGYVSADAVIRPLRDEIILEPIDSAYSSVLIVINEEKPIRGIVRAIGPGVYPFEYRDSLTGLWSLSVPKGRRTAVRVSKVMRPCDVKVGDLVSIEPFERQCFYWGETICLHCREEDVRFVEERAEIKMRYRGPIGTSA
jgi:co-chaperonin GroES (HSP10)